MSAALVLVFIVVVAYLATHVAFEWLARRFLIVSGAEYLLLGALIGPYGAGLLPHGAGDAHGALDLFAPLVTLALGWVGTIIGMQFYLPAMMRVRAVTWQVAWVEALATFATVGALTGLAAYWQFGLTLRASLAAGAAFGAVATACAPTGIEVVARRLGHRGPLMRQLEITAAVDALAAVIAIGLVACLRHVAPVDVRAPTPTEWAVISVAMGLAGGALFHLFLGEERQSPDRLVISLGGAVALASGAAAYLQLSPLLVAIVMGATLANTSPNRQVIAATLAAGERPFYFVLLVVAGASWQAGRVSWLLPLGLFVLARTVAKVGAARLSARLARQLGELGPHWGRALLGQGGLALAIALEYASRRGPLHELVFTATLVSVLLTDLASARLVHSVVAPVVGERRRRDRPSGEAAPGEEADVAARPSGAALEPAAPTPES